MDASFKFQVSALIPQLKGFLPLALFSVLWLDLIRLLSGNWEAREQYAYGWFVPFFAAALLWRRWQDRPQLSDLRSHPTYPDSTSGLSSHPFFKFQVSSFILLAALALLPLRVIFEINTDWPLIAWLYTLIVVFLTLYAFHLAGPTASGGNLKVEIQETGDGLENSRLESHPSSLSPASSEKPPVSGFRFQTSGSSPLPALCSEPASARSVAPSGFRFHPSSFFSPWLLHFAFPVCFILVALVWPYRIEKGLTQGLMQVVASITVEVLGWFNIPALQRGNLIEISTGVLGIDEACSGIRSFQSTLMAGLLMGELYRLRLLPRAALVAIGLGLAFTFNVVRTLLLTWQAEKEGMGAIDKWHDPAGYSIAIACFICLWALAVLAARKWGSGQKAESRKQKAEMPLSAAVPSEEPQVSGFSLPPATAPPTSDLGPPTSDLRPPTSASPVSRPQVSGFKSHSAKTPQVSGFRFHPSARSYLLAVGLWSLFCIFATEVWYRSHVSSNAGVFYWSIAMPTNNPTFEPVELPPRTTRLISADEAASGKWMEDGVEWSAHFFRWKPRSVSDVITSRVHRPEVCLTASGLEQVGDSELVTFDAGHLKLPFRRYTFRAEGRTLHVFFCQWEDGAEQQSGMQASKQADRLQSVLRGRRLVGQQTLEIILTGQSSLDQAEQAVRTHLPTLVQQETRGPWEGAETSLPYR